MQPTVDMHAALQKAARIIQRLEARVNELEAPDPIAIVGLGCRLPGHVDDLGSLWRVLEQGADVVSRMPAERFPAGAALDTSAGFASDGCVAEGGWLEAVDQFDAGFFGMSPREAAWTDPQQRLLLECAWEALEHAGFTRERLRDSTAGIYVGLGSHDYAHTLVGHHADDLEAYLATGTSPSFAAGRLAYVLGLQGPALTLDTSCSSSLVALHLACRAVRGGECELALVGGVHLMLSRLPFVLLSRLRALSPDGRCKAFSDRADGYGRSEGCIVLALERLSSARRHGDPVLGLVRGSAINHDGDKSGITTPNGNAQRAVIRQALADARLEASDVDYVEAHGTGTPLGDPIELDALGDVYGRGRTEPLRIGSLKANLGHLEAAAGLAGVLKVLAAFERQALPASLHARPPSSRVDWQANRLKVLTELEGWQRSPRARRAGVSSFGMSGTNAHLLLEEAPAAPQTAAPRQRPAELVVLSAKTAEALSAMRLRLHEQLRAHPELELADVAYTLAMARTTLSERWLVCAATRAELERALLGSAAGGAAATPEGVRGRAPQLPPELAWFLPDVGAQRLGMGRELYQCWATFRTAMDAAFEVLDPQLGRPLRSVMWAEPAASDRLDQPAYAASALFAYAWALAALWRSWGVEPAVLLGDGAGEITAACLGGVMSLSDGARQVLQHAAVRRAAAEDVSGAAAWVRALAASGAGVYLELAPTESLTLPTASHAPEQQIERLPHAAAGVSEYRATLNALAHWIARGGQVDYRGVFPDARRRVELPTYPWQRERHWVDGPRATPPAAARASHAPLYVAPLRGSPPAASRGDVGEVVATEVARVLSFRGPLPLDVPLGELGLDSVMALELESALGRRLDVSSPATLSIQSATARALADVLRSVLPETASTRNAGSALAAVVAHGQCLELIATPRARVFCFPGAGGSAAMFRPFGLLASEALEVHVVSHRRSMLAAGGTEGLGAKYLDDAVRYVSGLSGTPSILLGHSLGALFAWRVAAELVARGLQRPVLFVPSAMAPGDALPSASSFAQVLAPVLQDGRDPTAELGSVSLDFAADLALHAALPRHEQQQPLGCPIAAFVGGDDPLVSERSMQAWRAWTRSAFSLALLPGDHFYLHQPEPRRRFLDVLLEQVAACLTVPRHDRVARTR